MFSGGRVIRLLCGYTDVGMSRCVRWIALLEFVSDAFLMAAVLTLCWGLVGVLPLPPEEHATFITTDDIAAPQL